MIGRLLSCLRSLRCWLCWLAEVREVARGEAALYVTDTIQLQAASGGLEELFTHPLASECPIRDCRTCLAEPALIIRSEATDLGRGEIEGENILEVSVWLRHSLSDYWWDAPEGELQQFAYALLYLRDACEDGKVKVG